MGLENRQKTNQIFDGSKMNVPGQGIKTVQPFKDILKNKNSLFSPSDLQEENSQLRPTPPPTKTPNPTPNNTPTQSLTQSLTPTLTKTERLRKTPLPTRTPEKTPMITNSVSISLTPSKTNDNTPLPTRTNTPTTTMTKTIGITPTQSITPTIGVTPSYTPSLTQTLTPNGCFCYEINITQTDIDAANSNEIQSSNNKIVVQYYNCYEELITFTASTSGIYYICNRKFETLENFNIECLLTYTQLDLVYTNYLNPDYFTSTISTTYSSCNTTLGCQPPTPTISQTITMTPSITSTMTVTPTITPSNPPTPTITPSNPPTPTVTPSFTTTPTMTMTVTEYPCYNFDVTITQTDIDRASGNTEVNGVVSIVYYSCDEELVTELEVTSAGVYTICNKYKKTNQIYKQDVYLVYTQDDEAYNNYDNPQKFTSSFVRTSTVCPTLPPPPPPPPCNPLDFEPLVFTKIKSMLGKDVSLLIEFYSTPITVVDWGDGIIETIIGLITIAHTYTTEPGDIKIYSCDFNQFRQIQLSQGFIWSINAYSCTIENVTQFLPNLVILILGTLILTSGNIEVLSTFENLATLNLSSQELIYGDISYLPANLEFISLRDTIVTGDINNLQSQKIKALSLGTTLPEIPMIVTGDISVFISNQNNLTNLSVGGQNTIYGDINNIVTSNNGLVQFTIGGNNTITGNISNIPSSINNIYVQGQNTLYGDINSVKNYNNLTNLDIGGNNIITGNIANINPNIRNFTLQGQNTLFGDVNGLPANNNLQALSIYGNNIISGSLNNVPFFPKLSNFSIAGNNTLVGPVNTFVTNLINTTVRFSRLIIDPVYPGGLTSSEIDDILNGLVNISQWSPSVKMIELYGSNQTRTSNSDVAFNYLKYTVNVSLYIY